MTESADLSIEYLGLKLKNPVIVSAGPWSRDSVTIKKPLKAGAAAVVTASIVNETSPTHRPRLSYRNSQIANIRLYSEMTLEEWKRNIGEVKDAGGTLIASIMGESPSEFAYIAEAVERFGADAVEIGAAAPFGEGLEIKCSDPDSVYNYTSEVTRTVKIPVSVKMSATVTNPVACARAAERGGASAISAIDAVRSLCGIDIEKKRPYLPSYGGLSGPSIKPISLAVISMISEAVKIPLCGIGGIENYRDAVEYMMIGAQSVQIGSSILTQGYDNIRLMLDDLRRWMDEHNYTRIDDFKGCAQEGISSFQDLRTDPLIAELKHDCFLQKFNACLNACTYDAIERNNGKIILDPANCSGCGICVDLCPEKIISLAWN